MTYERPSPTFCINDQGKIERHDNIQNVSMLYFHCSADMEHKVDPPAGTRLYKLWTMWYNEVEAQFKVMDREDIDI